MDYYSATKKGKSYWYIQKPGWILRKNMLRFKQPVPKGTYDIISYMYSILKHVRSLWWWKWHVSWLCQYWYPGCNIVLQFYKMLPLLDFCKSDRWEQLISVLIRIGYILISFIMYGAGKFIICLTVFLKKIIFLVCSIPILCPFT